jgi:hypothetical protein
VVTIDQTSAACALLDPPPRPDAVVEDWLAAAAKGIRTSGSKAGLIGFGLALVVPGVLTWADAGPSAIYLACLVLLIVVALVRAWMIRRVGGRDLGNIARLVRDGIAYEAKAVAGKRLVLTWRERGGACRASFETGEANATRLIVLAIDGDRHVAAIIAPDRIAIGIRARGTS